MKPQRLILIAAVGVATLCPATWAVSHAQASPASGQGAGRGARGGGGGRESVRHTPSPGPDLGYGYDMNPLPLPSGMTWARHVSSVAINSKGHIFVFHRAEAGKPQLVEFDQNQKFVRAFGEDIALRAHSMCRHGPISRARRPTRSGAPCGATAAFLRFRTTGR